MIPRFSPEEQGQSKYHCIGALVRDLGVSADQQLKLPRMHRFELTVIFIYKFRSMSKPNRLVLSAV